MADTPGSPRLSYSLSGPEDGAPLVFVNGLGGVKEAWFYQLRHFSKKRRVLLYDHRGNGASEVVDEPADMMGYARDLLGLMDLVGFEQADLVGISFGGRVLQEFALAWPERVKRLALIATSCGQPPGRPFEPHRTLSRAHLLDEDGWYDEIVPVLFGRRYIAAQEKRLRVFARSRARNPPDPRGIDRQWEAWGGFDVCDRLGHIAGPTLVLRGRDDVLATSKDADRLARGIPGAEQVELDGVGHSPNVEDPTAFNLVLERFLEAG